MVRRVTTTQLDRTAGLLALAQALADPNRLGLFLALRETERCVRDLVNSQGLSQPLVSHHLKILMQAGLVEARRADGFNLYAVSPGGLAAARGVVSDVLDPDSVSPRARPGGNQNCCR